MSPTAQRKIRRFHDTATVYLETLYLKIHFAASQSFVNIMVNLVKSLTLKLKLLYGESTNLNEADTNLRQNSY